MTRKRISLLVAASAIALVTLPRPVQGQRSGVEIWAAVCGSCHIAQTADRYTAKDWDAIGTHMIITARLTDAEGEAVLEYLKGNALQPGDGEENPEAPAAVRTRGPASSQVRLAPELIAALAKYTRQLELRASARPLDVRQSEASRPSGPAHGRQKEDG